MRPALLLTLVAVPAAAGVLDDIGYTRLRAELGDDTPTGRGVGIAQVESPLRVDHDRDPATARVIAWMPNRRKPELREADIVDRSGAASAAVSGHATGVARRLVGSGTGMAIGVTALEVYSVNDWLRGQLRVGDAEPPLASGARVVNHSWAASFAGTGGGVDTQVLRRTDWLAERDELITVAGIRNAPRKTNQPLLASARNVIIVGRSDGSHSRGTVAVDRVYPYGRTRPHLVAPGKNSSAATPLVAGAVALLLETAADPVLSARGSAVTNRAGAEIHDAARVETVRAILMATADRNTGNGALASAYRAERKYRSDNGLDTRFGAGQLDVYAAWHVLAAGELRPGRERTAPPSGFDFVAGHDAESPASDIVIDLPQAARFSATLSWNLQFPGLQAPRFDASAVVPDLDLRLYAADGAAEQLLATSAGRLAVTENLHLALDAGRYRLEVRVGSDTSAVPDHALAWHSRPDVE